MGCVEETVGCAGTKESKGIEHEANPPRGLAFILKCMSSHEGL